MIILSSVLANFLKFFLCVSVLGLEFGQHNYPITTPAMLSLHSIFKCLWTKKLSLFILNNENCMMQYNLQHVWINMFYRAMIEKEF